MWLLLSHHQYLVQTTWNCHSYDSKPHPTLCNEEPEFFWAIQVLSSVLNFSCKTSFSPTVLDCGKRLVEYNRFQLQLLTSSLEWLQKLRSNCSKVGGISDKYSGPFLPSPTKVVDSEDGPAAGVFACQVKTRVNILQIANTKNNSYASISSIILVYKRRLLSKMLREGRLTEKSTVSITTHSLIHSLKRGVPAKQVSSCYYGNNNVLAWIHCYKPIISGCITISAAVMPC